ncbi:MAG: hypothetical protein HC915_04435 [Anaerolineae bacterium]|nr:hypothetical protein [Anaerolineae bacterium]
MECPTEILDLAYATASRSLEQALLPVEWVDRVALVRQHPTNRAGARLLLACALAKTPRPELDIRKPYTEIGGRDSYSGRSYDEDCIGPFIQQEGLGASGQLSLSSEAILTLLEQHIEE